MAYTTASPSQEAQTNQRDAQMLAVMMNDLGIENRNRITSYQDPEDEVYVDIRHMPRGPVSEADKERINAWNNSYETLGGDKENPEYEDIASGQTHRARLNATLRPNEAGPLGYGRGGLSAGRARGGFIGRERGRGGRSHSRPMENHPIVRYTPAELRAMSNVPVQPPTGPRSRGGHTTSDGRILANINAALRTPQNTPSSPLPRHRLQTSSSSQSTEAFDPSRIATPATFFAAHRRESVSPVVTATTFQPTVNLPDVTTTTAQTVQSSSAELSVSRPPSENDIHVHGVDTTAQGGPREQLQPSDLRTPPGTQNLSPHLRATKASQPLQKIEPSTTSLIDSTPSPKTIQEFEETWRQKLAEDIEENATEPQRTLSKPTGMVEVESVSAQPSLIDDGLPTDFNAPSLMAGHDNLLDAKSEVSNVGPSYSDDLRDIDFTQGWENTAPIASQSNAAGLTEGNQNDRQYIFDRIAQLTCYMPEKDRQEIVDLLKVASGFSTGDATSGSTADQTPPAAYDAQALSGVVLERTSNTEATQQGQTQLTQGEVRKILARGPVPQSESQTEQNIQIQMLLRTSTEAGIVVPILRSRKHPMFPDNVITRYYAGIGESHGQLSDIPDVMHSRSQSLLKELDTTQNIKVEPLKEHGSSHAQRATRRFRQLPSNGMPQFRTEIIPHELPTFLANCLSPRQELIALSKPEQTVTAKPEQTAALDTTAADSAQPRSLHHHSIRKSIWAPRPDDRITQLPIGGGTLAEVQNLRLAEHVAPRIPNLGSAPRNEHTRVGPAQPAPKTSLHDLQMEDQPTLHRIEKAGTRLSDAGAAARAQHIQAPKSGTSTSTAPQHRFLTLTTPSKPSDPGAAARAQYAMPSTAARNEDLSAAARAQYIGHRRVYSGDQDSLAPSSAGIPSGARSDRAQRKVQETGRSN